MALLARIQSEIRFRINAGALFKKALRSAPDLDGGGLGAGSDVVGGPMCGYKMFRKGMIDEVTSISTYH